MMMAGGARLVQGEEADAPSLELYARQRPLGNARHHLRKWLVRTRSVSILILCLLGGGGLSVQGQTLAGTVGELEGGRPVVGAIVRVVADSVAVGAGVVGPATLTDDGGRYRLRVAGPDSYHLLVERIGFAATRTGPVRVPASGVVVHDVRVAAAPVALGGLSVDVEGRRCELDEAGAEGTQRLWDEARKALTAARITESERVLRFRLVTRERTLAPRSLAVQDETRRTRTAWDGNTIRSLPAEDLARRGYVRDGPEGTVDYYAPDAAALLSGAFLATHCFGVLAPSEREAGLLGLAFEPVPGRGVPDIEGVIWLERGTGRLERLAFSYTGLPPGPGDDGAEGEVQFTELPDGRWIVTRWWIRAPVVGEVRSSSPLRGTRNRRMVTAILERGSVALEARGEGVEWSASTPPATLAGLVYDSVAEAPLPGAVVRLAGRGWRTRADSLGRFGLEGLSAGTYRLTFDHPRLDTLGFEPAGVDVELVAGETAERTLAVPSRGTLAALACGGGATVYGRVLDGEGTAVPGVSVQGTLTGSDAPDEFVTASTDDGGWYRLCGVPPDISLEVVARVGPIISEPGAAEPAPNTSVRIDLTLRGRGAVAADTGERDRPSVYGRVVEERSGEPLLDVLVTLMDGDGRTVQGALTDSEGRFALEAGPGRRYRIRSEHLGYATLESEPLSVGPRGQRLELRMVPQALEVEGVVVEVEARDMRLDRVGFYDREFHSGGTFLHPDEVVGSSAMRTSDLLLRVPGVERFYTHWDGNTTVSRIRLRGASRASGHQNCLPAIYVDGALVRRGGDITSGNTHDFPELDDLVSPHIMKAVEIYATPAEIPVQFTAMGALCGVIIIWTQAAG